MRHFLVATLAASALGRVACAQAAQKPARPDAGVESITEADIKRRIYLIADDSLRGRETPSPGLDKVAEYAASEFKRFGLKPGGDNGTFVQRYAIVRRRVDSTGSEVVMRVGSTVSKAPLAWAAAGLGSLPEVPSSGGGYLLGGPVTTAAIERLDVRGKAVIWVTDLAKPTRDYQRAIEALYAKQPVAVIMVSNRDSGGIARNASRQFRERTTIGSPGGERGIPLLEVFEGALRPALMAAGIAPAELRSSTTVVSRPLPDASVTVTVRHRTIESLSAPNSVGILEGSDPVLKNEYIVFSAHMDHVGVGSPAPGTTDSIYNGADDDASGTAGVIELAEAYAKSGMRPKRSLIFLTVSGEEKGLWGSDYFAEHPPVPINQIVADLNMDMIGRNWKDTIVAIGKEHSDLGATLDRVNAAHPELGMKAIDDIWPQEQFYYRSDHFNFARRGVPILFFFSGTHPDYHRATDEPAKIDVEKEMRIVKLVYYLGQEIGNAPARPKWKPESYKEIVRP